MKTFNLSMAHIVIENPIIADSQENKQEYLNRLKKYLTLLGVIRRKYVMAELEAYKKIIYCNDKMLNNHSISYYQYYIVFDLFHILEYKIDKKHTEKLIAIKKQYISDFKEADINIFNKIKYLIIQDKCRELEKLVNDKELANEKKYVELVQKNISFKKKTPFEVLVTATMSSGKSTFINSLVGKYVCLSQNLVCTSKIHSIFNKSYEDGYSYEYDHDLVMTAGKEELLNDNNLNLGDKIIVSTHYDGILGSERIIIHDSPGVNFSGDVKHKIISNKLIKSRNYKLLIYVMDLTQTGTNDEAKHLEFVKRTIGRCPVIFILNKIDSLCVEDENVEGIIERRKDFLKKSGFKNPLICPMSARAGYLAKQFQKTKLSKTEKRELYNHIDKFEQMDLVKYYENHFPEIEVNNKKLEEEQLLKTCGLEYVEQIIKRYAKGGE